MAEEFGFENVEYEEILKNSYSAFCKLNPEGFEGSKIEKQGYLIGPTIPKHENEDDIPSHYELFSPKIYLKSEPNSSIITQYRLIVVCSEGFTFALFLEEEKFMLSFEVYEKMRDFIFDK